MKIGLEIGDNLLEAIKYVVDRAYNADEDIGEAVQDAFGIDFSDISENYADVAIKIEKKGKAVGE